MREKCRDRTKGFNLRELEQDRLREVKENERERVKITEDRYTKKTGKD